MQADVLHEQRKIRKIEGGIGIWPVPVSVTKQLLSIFIDIDMTFC